MKTESSRVEVVNVDATIAQMEAEFAAPKTPVDTTSFQSSPFIKDLSNILDEAPVYANQYTDSVVLDFLDRDVLRDAPELKLGSAATPNTVEVAEKTKNIPEKTRRSLGKKVREAYYAGMATAVSKLPRTRSKEEFLELDAAQKAKYAEKPGDGFFTRHLNDIRRNKYEWYSWSPVAAMGATAFAMFALRAEGYFGAVESHAAYDIMPLVSSRPIDLVMGGHTQGDAVGSGYVDSLAQAGIINPHVDDVRPVNWSANMAPISGDEMSMNMSDQEGAARLTEAIHGANGAPVRIIAFSQGTEATLRALNTIAAENGGTVPDNITVVLQGTPSGDLGIGKNPLVHTANPFLSAAGIETNQPIPPGAHVIVRTDVADVFGNGGNQSALKLAEMAVGPGHQVVGPNNSVMLYTYQKDGVTYEVWGDPQGVNDPLLRFAKQNGLPVSPEAEQFMEALVPDTPPNAPGPVYANADNVANSFAAMTDRAISDNTGGAPSDYARKATAAVMSDPTIRTDLQTALDLQRVPDQLNDAIQHPQNAAANLQAVNTEVTNAINTGMSYIQNPNKVVDATNRGLVANGVPPLVPHVEQVQQVVNQIAEQQRTAPAQPNPLAQQAVGFLSGFFNGTRRR